MLVQLLIVGMKQQMPKKKLLRSAGVNVSTLFQDIGDAMREAWEFKMVENALISYLGENKPNLFSKKLLLI